MGISPQHLPRRGSEHGETFALLPHTSQKSDGRGLRGAGPPWVGHGMGESIMMDAVRYHRAPDGFRQIMFGRLPSRVTDENGFVKGLEISMQVAFEHFQAERIWIDRSVEGSDQRRMTVHGERLMAQRWRLRLMQMQQIEMTLANPTSRLQSCDEEITQVRYGTVVWNGE